MNGILPACVAQVKGPLDFRKGNNVGNNAVGRNQPVGDQPDALFKITPHVNVPAGLGAVEFQPFAVEAEEIDRNAADADAAIEDNPSTDGRHVDGVYHPVSFKQTGDDDVKAVREILFDEIGRFRVMSGKLIGVGGSIAFCKLQVFVVQVGDYQIFGGWRGRPPGSLKGR